MLGTLVLREFAPQRSFVASHLFPANDRATAADPLPQPDRDR